MAASGRFSPADEPGALTPRQRLYCAALAGGATASQAAVDAKISERTGRRWREREGFRAAIRARQAEDMAIGRAVLVAGVAKCARQLVAMGAGEVEADGATVAAARAVLDGALGWMDLADLTARLDALEAQGGARRER